MKLRPYQQEALAKLAHRQLTVLPTGTGKTRIMAEMACRHDGAMILVHREELIDQTVRTIRALRPDVKVGIVQGPQKEWRAVTVIMQQTIRRKIDVPETIYTLIVDEAHRYTTKASAAVLDACEARGAKIYGFTATPAINGRPIFGPGMPFTGISYRRTTVSMIREGYLCDARALSVRLGGLDLRKVKTSQGDYSAASLGAAMGRIHAPARIVEAWQEHAADRKRTIVFLPTVELGHETTDAFRAAGVAAEEAYGDTPKSQRELAIGRIRTGETRVLVNVLVGAEGFDVPEIDCVVQARPTKSWTLYTQCLGRGLRPAPGKTDLLLLDIAGNVHEHDLVTMPKALEMGRLPAGKSVREATEGRSPREVELEHERAQLEEALLFAPVHWHTWGEEHVAAFDGENVLVLAPIEDETGSVLYGVFRTNVRSGEEQKVSVHEFPAEASEAAEDLLRSEGDPQLYKRSARWRREPPSERQIRVFASLPEAERPKTRGEAAERLTLALYKRVRRRA